MSYESFSSKPSSKPVFTMHGVNRIELPDKRTSVKPGSLPIYTGKSKIFRKNFIKKFISKLPCSGPYSLDYYDEMYPNDIYDWSNDPNDYDFDNGGNYGGNAYQGSNRTQGFYGDQHDNMNDSCQCGEMTCFEKSKIWKRYFSTLI